MYYVLHKPHGEKLPWLELPGFRSSKEARAAVKTLDSQRTNDGGRLCDVKLCVGRGRNRRDILILDGRTYHGKE